MKYGVARCPNSVRFIAFLGFLKLRGSIWYVKLCLTPEIEREKNIFTLLTNHLVSAQSRCRNICQVSKAIQVSSSYRHIIYLLMQTQAWMKIEVSTTYSHILLSQMKLNAALMGSGNAATCSKE